MKLGKTEISDLSDNQLKAVYENHLKVESERSEFSKHPKFNNDKKLQFPQINHNFLNLKNEIIDEMKKRELIK